MSKFNRSGFQTSIVIVVALVAASIVTVLDRSPSTTAERSENALERQELPVSQAGPRSDSSAPPSPVVAQASGEEIDTPVPASPPASAQSHDAADEASTQRVADWPVTLHQDSANRTAAATDPDDTRPAAATNPNPGAPTECLPEGLQAVLADLETEFGPVTIVSTTHLHTANHTPGSIRENLHFACKAVDIKTPHQPNEVIAFLRLRSEVGGINTYRNGVIHFDLNANHGKTASKPSTAQQRALAKTQRQPQARVGAMAQDRRPKAGVIQQRPTPQLRQQGETASHPGNPLASDQLFSRGSLPTNSPISAFQE
jgi:hypothetical protein